MQDSTTTGVDIQQLCVYCGSSTGSNPAVSQAAVSLGRLLGERNIGLVYGGGAVGLMGRIANEVLAGGGSVTGIIPTSLFPPEVTHDGLTELIDVNSMHERKAAMMERADAFVALPGGFGTLEELVEALTWAQLGLLDKPVGLLNVDGYYDHLLAFFDRAVEDQLLRPSNRALIRTADTPETLIDSLLSTRVTAAPKWNELGQTETGGS